MAHPLPAQTAALTRPCAPAAAAGCRCLQSLAQTQLFTMFDAGMSIGAGFGPGPSHLFGDLIEMALIQRANDAVAMAARKTLEASVPFSSCMPHL